MDIPRIVQLRHSFLAPIYVLMGIKQNVSNHGSYVLAMATD